MNKEFIRQQFNEQAERFANFGLTRNEEIFKFVYDYCKFDSNDVLLDVACGSGAFVNFCSKTLKASVGVDISNELIKYGMLSPNLSKTNSSTFICGDVEHLPFLERIFTIITCRSAFHHMENPDMIVKEMVRVSKNAGKICIQDMTSFSNAHVNEFFEKMEKLVDPSHHRTLSTYDIERLLYSNHVKIVDKFEATLTHDLPEYFGHAIQSEKSMDLLSELVCTGLNDPEISKFFFERNKKLYFQRRGLVIYGNV